MKKKYFMIKKDKLNIDSFTDKDGKNYRKAEALEKKDVADFFSKKGYRVLEIQQLWRHVHGKLEKDNKIYFFKMSSTETIGERTQNETLWNKQIGALIKESQIDCFDVPEIYDTGDYHGKFYYLSSFHDGPMLATKTPLNTEKLVEWLDKIVATNIFFLSLRGDELQLNRDRKPVKMDDYWSAYLQKLQSWYHEVEDQLSPELLKAVNEFKSTFEPGVNHGDFVPWHMIKDGEKFILIDGEHASTQAPRYYDACYFYHRLYTSAQNPELAKTYLRKLRQALPEAERTRFDIMIRPILAARIIGGFWDAKTDGQTDVSYHQKLKDDFLQGKLL
jgi:hypothetical protein